MKSASIKDKKRIKKNSGAWESKIWQVLVSKTHDFVQACGFQKVLLGLSGGVDSSLVAALAVEAVGKENVLGVLMPSIYSSKQSVEDAKHLAKNLGINTLILPINSIVDAVSKTLKNAFLGYHEDVTEENIQSRVRCVILMALSNKFHALLLATGNKSELATGYCTLYGDLAGGLAPLGDVLKTQVYSLAKWLNKRKADVIPASILKKEPSAELKPNQKDSDTLPPYEILDGILFRYTELHQSKEKIIEAGYKRELVKKVLLMVQRSEFKRKQAPPGIKITDKIYFLS